MPLLKLLFVKVTRDRLTFLFLVTKAQIIFFLYSFIIWLSSELSCFQIPLFCLIHPAITRFNVLFFFLSYFSHSK